VRRAPLLARLGACAIGLSLGLILGLPAVSHAYEDEGQHRLQLDSNQVELPLDFTLAERTFIHARWEGFQTRIEQGPLPVGITCATSFSRTLTNCWTRTIDGAPTQRGNALEHVLNRHALSRNAAIVSAAVEEAVLAPNILHVDFEISLDADQLAMPAEDVEPSPLGDSQWTFKQAHISFPHAHFGDDVQLATQCRTHRDFSVSCRAISATPARRFDRLSDWLERETPAYICSSETGG